MTTMRDCCRMRLAGKGGREQRKTKEPPKGLLIRRKSGCRSFLPGCRIDTISVTAINMPPFAAPSKRGLSRVQNAILPTCRNRLNGKELEKHISQRRGCCENKINNRFYTVTWEMKAIQRRIRFGVIVHVLPWAMMAGQGCQDISLQPSTLKQR